MHMRDKCSRVIVCSDGYIWRRWLQINYYRYLEQMTLEPRCLGRGYWPPLQGLLRVGEILWGIWGFCSCSVLAFDPAADTVIQHPRNIRRIPSGTENSGTLQRCLIRTRIVFPERAKGKTLWKVFGKMSLLLWSSRREGAMFTLLQTCFCV